MIFLIEYEASRGRLISMRRFADAERGEAADARLQLELELGRHGIVREVVVLEAASEDDIRRTHGRYFLVGDPPYGA